MAPDHHHRRSDDYCIYDTLIVAYKKELPLWEFFFVENANGYLYLEFPARTTLPYSEILSGK